MKSIDRELLKSVSRSFYLSIHFLPAAMREPVGIGYLIARLSDTIADAPGIDSEHRLELLEGVRQTIQNGAELPDFSSISGRVDDPGEQDLLESAARIFDWFGRVDRANREHLDEVLLTILHGQKWDIEYFSPNTFTACETRDDLLRYTYWVAGSVGEFWTKVGFTNLGNRFAVPDDATPMLMRGRKLGQALQLVNVLRDLHEDLPAGRCYLPAEELRVAGWRGDALPSLREIEPVFSTWTGQCRQFLEESEAYFQRVLERRVRFSTKLPKILAEKTLARLECAGVEQVLSRRVKIPRSEVWKAMARAICC